MHRERANQIKKMDRIGEEGSEVGNEVANLECLDKGRLWTMVNCYPLFQWGDMVMVIF